MTLIDRDVGVVSDSGQDTTEMVALLVLCHLASISDGERNMRTVTRCHSLEPALADSSPVPSSWSCSSTCAGK